MSKNQKQRRKTPKRVSKATFFEALRISLVNQNCCYAEKMTSQLKGPPRFSGFWPKNAFFLAKLAQTSNPAISASFKDFLLIFGAN